MCPVQTNVSVIQYSYDGDGKRVMKVICPSGTSSCTPSVAGAVTTVYVYNAQGELAEEAGPSTDTGTKYMFVDGLGSTRLETDANGGSVRCMDYAPFGLELPAAMGGRGSCYATQSYPSGTPDSLDVKFSGKERDAESGLDYFGARYYGSSMGRFLSPDWSAKVAPVPYAKLDDPQSLNLYAYVRNNPLSKTDPDGHCIEDACIVEGAIALTAFAESPAGQRAEEEAEEAAERFAPEIESGLSRLSNWAGAQLARAGNALEAKAQEFTEGVKNTQRILQGQATGANYRVPDLMVKVGDDIKAIGEVKDTAKLSNTKQLADLMGAAKDSGAKFSLYLGEKTQLTKPLATQLYNNGAAVYRYTGGKFVDITKTLKPTQ